MKEWDKIEERFQKLIALGSDKRTPENERAAACAQAVRMIAEKRIAAVASTRLSAIGSWIQWAKGIMEEAESHVSEHFVGRDKDYFCKHPFNLNGKNGWQCCQCSAVNEMIRYDVGGNGTRYFPNKCKTCGHELCGTYEEKKNWT